MAVLAGKKNNPGPPRKHADDNAAKSTSRYGRIPIRNARIIASRARGRLAVPFPSSFGHAAKRTHGVQVVEHADHRAVTVYNGGLAQATTGHVRERRRKRGVLFDSSVERAIVNADPWALLQEADETQ